MKNIDVIKNMSSKELAQFMHDITMLCEFQKCTACPILRNGYCDPEAWLNDVYNWSDWTERFFPADDAVARAKGGQR